MSDAVCLRSIMSCISSAVNTCMWYVYTCVYYVYNMQIVYKLSHQSSFYSGAVYALRVSSVYTWLSLDAYVLFCRLRLGVMLLLQSD